MRSRLMGLAVAGIMALLTGHMGTAAAQDGRLFKIAAKEVKVSDDRVSIDVSDVRGSFKALRLYNKGAPVLIDNVRVVYGDDSTHNENRSIDLRTGERTKPIDPRSTGKFVDTVIVTLKPDAASKKTTLIEVWGVQDSAGARAERPRKKGGTAVAIPAPAPKGSDTPAAQPSPPAAAPATAEPRRTIESSAAPSKGRCVSEGYLRLGSGDVGLGVDRDVIRVGQRIGLFDKIRLCVRGSDIDLVDINAVYTDGSRFNVPYAGKIRDGHRSQALSLRGDHYIDKIEIAYKKAGATAVANVEVWGDLSEKFLSEEQRLDNDGWFKLGSGQTAGFVGFDVDKFDVPKYKRGFNEVRVLVKNRDITLDYFTLTFGDGKTQRIDAGRARVEPEKGYGPVKVDGGKRNITAVEARLRSRFFDKQAKGKENAIVEFWGR